MIDANKILQSNVLDLIFEGRNKEYGAYELRANYGKRLMISVISMMLLCGCVALLSAFAGKAHKQPQMYVVDSTVLVDVKPKDEIPPPQIEQPKPKPQQVKMEQFTSLRITNEDVKPDEMPPLVDDLDKAKIGVIKQDGIDDDPTITAPPISGNETGVIDQPKKQDDEADKIHVIVQIESEYPGGLSAWIRYLTKTLPKYYTGELIEQEIQGRVLVQFVVDTEGNVSDVRGIEGPKELMAAAEKVIRLSGKWTPAIQNGHKVKSYKKQPIIFKLEQE